MAWVKWLLLLLLTAFICKPYLQAGFPYTHDGENHLARFANYKIALREGQFPPRFAPNLNNHYGYPVFNYNYPLANILSLPFSFLKINYELTFKLLVAGFVFWALVGIWFWLCSYWALLLFASSPYLVNLIYFRGNIGEIMALCLLPWLFYALNNFSKFNKLFLILLLALFFLSHNIAVVFALPILFFYAFLKFKNNYKLYLNLLSVFLISFLLTTWFWLPAIFEKNLVILDQANLSQGFIDHFVNLSQLLFSKLEFGFSYLGSVDSLSFSLGLGQILVLILAVIYLTPLPLSCGSGECRRPRRGGAPGHTGGGEGGLCLLLFISQLNFTKFIWQNLPLANFIQFPWRLTLFFSILILPLSVLVFKNTHRYLKLFLIFILFLQFWGISKIKAADYFHKTNIDYDAFSQSTSTANENLPKNFTYQKLWDWQPTPSILTGAGEIKVVEWRGSYRKYNLDLKEKSVIVEPTMNFAGWFTRLSFSDSESENFGGERQTKLVNYIDNEEIAGRLAYELPAGKYEIESKFTQHTWPRLLGNGLSVATILALVIYFIYEKSRVL